MAFTRTNSGLKNMPLFFNVTYVAFVEGGVSYSIEDVLAGKYSNESIDSIFWGKVFKSKGLDSVKFKAVGSKSTVEKIASEICEHNLSNVIAAMDQEFDMINNTCIEHSNVLYTYGYSWENDVWNKKVICSVIETLSCKKIDEEIINEYYNDFLESVKPLVYLDGYLFQNNTSYFPRPKGHLKLFYINRNTVPTLKEDEIIALKEQIEFSQEELEQYKETNIICPKRNCYGHLFGDYCKHLISYILKQHFDLTGIKDEFIKRVAISCFLDYLDEDLKTHYNALMNN